jgi:hypothetical protein
MLNDLKIFNPGETSPFDLEKPDNQHLKISAGSFVPITRDYRHLLNSEQRSIPGSYTLKIPGDETVYKGRGLMSFTAHNIPVVNPDCIVPLSIEGTITKMQPAFGQLFDSLRAMGPGTFGAQRKRKLQKRGIKCVDLGNGRFRRECEELVHNG